MCKSGDAAVSDFRHAKSLIQVLTESNIMEIAALVCPNIAPHYTFIIFIPLHFKCNYICHNLSGFIAISHKVKQTNKQTNTRLTHFFYILEDTSDLGLAFRYRWLRNILVNKETGSYNRHCHRLHAEHINNDARKAHIYASICIVHKCLIVPTTPCIVENVPRLRLCKLKESTM